MECQLLFTVVLSTIGADLVISIRVYPADKSNESSVISVAPRDRLTKT